MHKAVRYNSDIYRIVNGDKIVGFASRYMNGKWAAIDVNDKTLKGPVFAKPTAVAKWFDDNAN